MLCLQRWHFVHRDIHFLRTPLMPYPSPNFSCLLASRAKSHGRRNMIRRKGTKNTFNDFMWRRQQNTPRNWQLDNLYYPFVLLLLYFYSGESVGAAITAFQLTRRLLGQRHGGRLKKARSLFAFYCFDRSLHGEDWIIYFCIPLFILVHTTEHWRLANWPRGALDCISQRERNRKTDRRSCSYMNLRYLLDALLVMSQGFKQRAKDMPPILTILSFFFFLIYVWRGFTHPDTTFLLLQQDWGGGIGVTATHGAEARLKGKCKKQWTVGWIGVGHSGKG